jgi:hypothetical protein
MTWLWLLPALHVVLFAWVERRTRGRWRRQRKVTSGGASPYRTAFPSRVDEDRAPWRVRAAALCSVLLGSVVAPGAGYALRAFRFEGIALSLLPEVATAAAAWTAGWLLLARVQAAVDLSRLTAVVSSTYGALLLGVALLHTIAARNGWTEHSSPAYVAVVLSVGVTAMVHAALLRAAVRRHASAFPRPPTRSP